MNLEISSTIFNLFRETECEQGRSREREGDTESKVCSRLQAISTEPNAGFEPRNREIMP